MLEREQISGDLMAEKLMQYEAMFLFGSGAASDIETAIKTVRTMIERHGGEVLVAKKWDERKLAYEISGNKRGLYVLAYFKAPGAAVTPIVRDVELSDQLLRVMVTDAEHLNAEEMAAVEPQPIQPREERPLWKMPYENDRPPRRDDRGPRDDRPGRSRRDEIPSGADKD
jgi:small subunit ribosomal protein S6